MINVLSRASRGDVRLDPFPHIVLADALEPELYSALSAAFPPVNIIAGSSASAALASNRRYSMPAWPLMLRDDIAPIWKSFLEEHTSAAFLQTVVATFAGCWDSRIADRLTEAAERRKTGLLHRDRISDDGVLLDARIEINSPVTGAPSSARGAHLDTPNRLYSGLFYLRDPQDDSTGGELEVFRWRSAPSAALDVLELPADAVEKVGSIAYRPNQLVLFPQNLHALHGVGMRHPTPHIRRYVFITAEIDEDWLTAGAESSSLEAIA